MAPIAGTSKTTVSTMLGIACVVFAQFALLDAAPECKVFHDGFCPPGPYACPFQPAPAVPIESTCKCDHKCAKDEKCCPRCGADTCIKAVTCPVPPPDVATPCDVTCQDNVPCPTPGQFCCPYGCGRQCRTPVWEVPVGKNSWTKRPASASNANLEQILESWSYCLCVNI